MDTASIENMKQELISTNPEFREMARTHGAYEERLSVLSALPYPSEDEQWEEVTLKKKKLALKDQMYEMLAHYRKSHAAH